MRKSRNTIQRALVLEAVSAIRHHPNADTVYLYIKMRHPGISKATVYRNLNALAQSGNIKKIPVSGGADRFDHRTHKHYHIACDSCGAFSDVEIRYAQAWDEELAVQTGYKMDCHDIVFRGVCPRCQTATMMQKEEELQ